MANYFIAQTARGTGDGSTSANAAIASFFNTAANWSATLGTSGKISPGDVVWICDRVSTPLAFQGSGTPGNPITLTWEPGAKMSAGTWATAAVLCEGDNYAGLKHDIVIDGFAGGRIEATASGTGKTYSTCGYGVRCVGTSQVEIKNLRVLDLFVRTVGTDTSTPGTLISVANAVNAAMADVSVHDCILQHGFIGVGTGYNLQGTSNVSIYNNTIRYINWGVQCGSEVVGATIDNLQIYGNTISNFSNWDEPGTNNHHHNGIFVWTNNGDTTGTCTGLRIFGNTIGSDFGSFATSGIYVSAPGHRSEIWIYNNLCKSFGSNPTNGDIFVVPGSGATTRIYNNTFVGSQGIAIGYGGDHGGAQTLHLRNNIVRGSGGGKVAVYVSYQDLVTITSNNNSFSGLSTAPTGFSRSSGNSASFRTWAEWQAYGYDAASLYETDPLLDADYRLTSTSPCLNTGTDLSAYLTTDILGKARAPYWDIGAFKGFIDSTAPIYIADTDLGSADGLSAINAKGMAWLNLASSWNASGPVCPDATKNRIRTEIRWVGTITNPFDWPYATAPGEAGIKFTFTSGSKFSRPHWGAGRGCAIYWESAAYTKNDVTIDFGVDGCIECTANGTALTYQQPSTGIIALSPRRLTILNPRIYNMYVRTFGEEQEGNNNGIYVSSYGPAVTDLKITGGEIHDVNVAINTTGGVGSKNFLFEGLHIYNVNWGMSCSLSAAGASMTGLTVRGNHVHNFENWDVPIETTGLEAFHHNAVFLFAESSAANFIDATIEGNLLGPNFGTEATSALFISHWSMRGEYTIRNNILKGSTTNGLLTAGCGAGATINLHNNTFVVGSPGNAAARFGGDYAGLGTVTIKARNNVFSNGMAYSFGYAGKLVFDSDYNLVHGYASPFPGPIVYSLANSGSSLSWAEWQGTYGQDAHSLLDQNPLLDGDGRPGTGSPALEAGTDLSAHFTDDYEGATRVAPWDMGAYEGEGETPPAATGNPLAFRSNAMLAMGAL